MNRQPTAFSLTLCAALMLLPPHSTSAESSLDAVNQAFAAVDASGDHQLSLEEYTAGSGNSALLKRNFSLFDADGNKRLTQAEFAAVPDLKTGPERGPLPDPFNHLVDAAVASVDQVFVRLGKGERTGVEIKRFVRNVVGSLNPEIGEQSRPEWASQADPDGDGEVTRDEARRFIEIHLGIRAPSGEPLRAADGRVLALGRFLRIDGNGDSSLTPDELRRASKMRGALPLDHQLDDNGDGTISWEEFAGPHRPGWEDPIEWFRHADTNLDARLDRAEAQQATDESRQVLVPMAFSAFDEDRDGRLTLDEYRLSMLGNPVYAWEKVPRDSNDDGSLSLAEFEFEAATCELLRLFYFHQLDRDQDNKLSPQECPIRLKPPEAFHQLAADGSEFRLLYSNEEYPYCGSPAVSPDGKRIVFDGRRRGETLRQQRILMISIDGKDFQDVCAGLMPTWSKDGTQFACSRYGEPSGIWIVNADGSQPKRISDGWGAQWSPDGESIAFTKENGLWRYDVASGESHEILPAVEHPYRLIYWNMGWSPDSRRLIFKGRKDRAFDVVSVNMAAGDPDLQVHYSTEEDVEPDLAWSPDGSRVLVGLKLPDQTRQLLCQLDPSNNDPPKPVVGLDPSLTYRSCCFTPDGKWIVVKTSE